MFQKQTQPIMAELEKILSRGYNHYDVFSDWIDLMLYALMRNDPEYLKIVGRYRNVEPIGRREIDHFKDAFHLLLAGMAETNEELLGEIYMSWNVSNKYTGQFFTPTCVARMMAEVLQPTGGNIMEPCCGAGVFIVQMAKVMTNEQLDKTNFRAIDIDLTCVKMCALNMTFFNLNGQIECADSLSMERPSRAYRTVRSPLGGSIIEIDPETIKMPEIEDHKPILPINKDNFNQMSLFN